MTSLHNHDTVPMAFSPVRAPRSGWHGRPGRWLFAGTLLWALGAQLQPATAHANEVTDWNTHAAKLLNEQSPVEQARSLAMVQVAVHDALNAIERRYEPYVFNGHSHRASAEAAVATATVETLMALLPASSVELDALYTQALAVIPAGRAKRNGVKLGRAAAQAIVSQRSGDDVAGALTKPYIAGERPGDYRATPPDNVVLGAGWGEIPTFVMPRASTFRPPPPLRLRGKRYAKDYNEVKRVGKVNSLSRTPEQTEIADFWYESSSTGWHRIANLAIKEHNLDLWESARLLGLVGLTLSDGFVNGFDAKYHYNYWRPVTAIRLGDEDGNYRTHGDPDWAPYCATPPVPDYPSTHSLLGAAAAEVLARYFGDATSFAIDSLSLPGVMRSFESFSQAARENADSRVYCGIHWRSAVEAGFEQGRRLGRYVFKHALKPAASR